MKFKTLKFADDEVKNLKKANRFISPRILNSAQEPVAIIDRKRLLI